MGRELKKTNSSGSGSCGAASAENLESISEGGPLRKLRRFGGRAYSRFLDIREDRRTEWSIRLDRCLASRVDLSQSIILNGFWRSGTTWIQDLVVTMVQGKSLFEPFAPSPRSRATPIARYVARFSDLRQDLAFVAGVMPIVGCDRACDAFLWPIVDDAMRCRLSDHGGVRNRRGVLESFRRRVVVKFVRGHLMLEAMHVRYGIPVIHIRRDPYAVVGSLCKSETWGLGAFADPDLNSLLLFEGDGRHQVFEPWRDQIEAAMKSGHRARKIALYWALVERVADEQLARMGSGAALLRYESLTEGGVEKLRNVLAGLGAPHNGIVKLAHFRRASVTADTTVERKSPKEFAGSSLRHLDAADWEAISHVLEVTGFSGYIRPRSVSS